MVYDAGDGCECVFAMKARTGRVQWRWGTGGLVFSSPAVANGVVYVGIGDVYSGGGVYALDASTGAVLWSYPTSDWVQSSPAVTNGVVYVGGYDGNVYAFGLE